MEREGEELDHQHCRRKNLRYSNCRPIRDCSKIVSRIPFNRVTNNIQIRYNSRDRILGLPNSL
jgi:hypothetical protein